MIPCEVLAQPQGGQWTLTNVTTTNLFTNDTAADIRILLTTCYPDGGNNPPLIKLGFNPPKAFSPNLYPGNCLTLLLPMSAGQMIYLIPPSVGTVTGTYQLQVLN